MRTRACVCVQCVCVCSVCVMLSLWQLTVLSRATSTARMVWRMMWSRFRMLVRLASSATYNSFS